MLKSAWLLAAVVGLAVLSTASPSNPRELRALKAALKKQQRAKELRIAAAAAAVAKSPVTGSGEYVPDSGPWSGENEPSCEQLREMWRQSKRHSRAAEATNEVPQYADPLARAGSPYGAQWASLVGEPTLRQRSERRPVVYGRPLRRPPTEDAAERSPLETLRREALHEHDASAFRLAGVDPSAGVVLASEDERSPFAKSPAKGQFNTLRDFVRREGAAGGLASGGYERLRDALRQEKASRSRDWTETDVGRVVMSPSELGAAKPASLYGMQSDAPYEGHGHGRRPAASNANRLAAFFGAHKAPSMRNSKTLVVDSNEQVDGRMKAFQLRDPLRQRLVGGGGGGGGQQHRLPGRTRFTATIDPEDQGVVRGYVVGRNSNPFYSQPSRRSSPGVEEQTETCGLEPDGVCRRNADCRCLVRLFGSRSALLTAARCKRARCLDSKSKSAKVNSIRDDGLLAEPEDGAGEQQAPGREHDAGETLSRSDVSQLIRALRLDATNDDSDDSSMDEPDESN